MVVEWNDFRTAERIGRLLTRQLPPVGRITVHRNRPVVSGTGYSIVVEERMPPAVPACVITMGGEAWTVPLDGDWDRHVDEVVGQLVPRIRDIRAAITHQTIGVGDRFRARRSGWGIRRGSTFTVVRQISHMGHDPVVTYELDGLEVPLRVVLPIGGRFNRVWERL